MALGAAPLYQEFRGSGDWMFWIEMAEQGRVAFVDKKPESLSSVLSEHDGKDATVYAQFGGRLPYLSVYDHAQGDEPFESFEDRFWRIYSLLFYTEGLDAKKRKEGLRIWRSNAILHIFACLTRLYVKIRTGE